MSWPRSGFGSRVSASSSSMSRAIIVLAKTVERPVMQSRGPEK